MVSRLGIDIKSINIVQVFLDCTCLLEITYLVKSPVQLVVVAIVLPNGILDVSPSIECMLVRLPPIQRIFFCTSANICLSLYIVVGLCDSEAIIHL